MMHESKAAGYMEIRNKRTFRNNGSACPVVGNHLDVPEVGVAVKDAVGPGCCLAVVKGQGYDAPEKSWIFKWLDGWIEVTFIWKVNAFQYGPLRVEQVTLVALADEAVLCQAAVGAGARPAAAAQVEAQLLAASVAPGAWVCSCKTPTHVQLQLPASFAVRDSRCINYTPR